MDVSGKTKQLVLSQQELAEAILQWLNKNRPPSETMTMTKIAFVQLDDGEAIMRITLEKVPEQTQADGAK